VENICGCEGWNGRAMDEDPMDDWMDKGRLVQWIE